MLVIRLQRTGRKNTPTYRIVVSEKTKHVSKGSMEVMGHYLPAQGKPVFECDQTRIAHWVKQGAIPSNTVARLLNKAGMKDMEKYMLRYTKKKSKDPEVIAAAEAAAAAAAAPPPAPAAEAPAAA